MHNHYEHNIKNKTDFKDPILKYLLVPTKASLIQVLSLNLKGLMKKKFNTTQSIKEKWESE